MEREFCRKIATIVTIPTELMPAMESEKNWLASLTRRHTDRHFP